MMKTDRRSRLCWYSVIQIGVSLLCTLGMLGSAFAAPTFDAGTSLVRGNPPDSEISGIDSSVSSPGVYWVHGDSDGVRVHTINSSMQRLGTYEFAGAPDSQNYEDIAIGPGPVEGVSYIYFGDIGDNGFNRRNIRIYRMPEPVVYVRQAGAPVSKSYPDSVWDYVGIDYPGIIFFDETDAEGLMCDPRNADLYITSKESGTCRVFRVPASSFVDGNTVSVTTVATKNFDKATAACISPNATELIIKGYSWAYLYQIGTGQSIQDALNTSRISVPWRNEPQGEAVGYEKSGSGYLTISEGSTVDLWYFSRTSNDGPMPQLAIIPPESQWRYLDNGSNQGTAWRSPVFDDAGWNSGLAHMGYGDGDEQTVLGYGGNPSNKYVTNYFRKTFCVDNSVAFQTLKLRVVWEGGVAAYLNGTEVMRKSLAANAPYNALATGTRGVTKYSWLTQSISPTLLVNGENTIAVETHLASTSQADMSFDVQLEGSRTYTGQNYQVNIVTQSDPPGLIVPSVSLDGGATDIASGGSRSFWVHSAATTSALPYTAYEATSDEYNLDADGAPPCNCINYADGGDPACWPLVTATNAVLYKGNATWPAANHFDWYNVYYPTGPVTITATYKARAIPVTYQAYISGPTTVYHEVTGHSIIVTPTVLPGYTLTGVSATSGVTTDLANGTWRLSNVTDFGGTTVSATYEIDGYTLTYTAGANGSISGTSPQNVSPGADGMPVTAVPNTGYHFVQWSDGVLTATRTDTNVTSSISVTATFAPNANAIAYVSDPVAGGIVSGPATVLTGGTAALTVTRNVGYTYASISATNGPVTGTYPDFALSNVSAPTTVTVTFTANSNPISYMVNPSASGTVNGPATVMTGETAALTVTENFGYNLQNITATNGTISGSFPHFTLSDVTAATTVMVTFTNAPVWTLSYTVTPEPGGSVTGPASIYRTLGLTAVLIVTTNPGYTLDSLAANNDATITGSGPYTLGNVTADTVVTATFTPNTNAITCTVTPPGSGTLAGPATVLTGSSAALTATTNAGYTYTSITATNGTVSGAYPNFTLSGVTMPTTVTANFAINQYTLTYNAGANGSISGTSPQTVNHGTDGIAVTAVAITGYHFVQWSDGVLTASRADTDVTANIDVTASFERSKGTVIVQVTPDTAPWNFSDGDAVGHAGTGDAVLPGIPTGQIALTWGDLDGFIAPQGESLVLVDNGTVTFTGVYGPEVTFTTSPQDQRRYVGDVAIFEVVATGGLGMLHYQWWLDNGLKAQTPVGEDLPTLVLDSVSLSDSGTYWCEVTDDFPASYPSPQAVLEVGEHLRITQHPQGADKNTGQSHAFTVGTSGGLGSLSYAWQKDGTALDDTNSATYTLPFLTPEDAGAYAVLVSDEVTDVVQSNTAVLTVNVPSVPLSVIVGTAVLLTVLGVGGVSLIRRK